MLELSSTLGWITVMVLLAGGVILLPPATLTVTAVTKTPRARVISARAKALVAALGIAAATAAIGAPWPVVLIAPPAAAVAVLRSYRGQRDPTGDQLRELAGLCDLLAATLAAGLPVADALQAVLAASSSTSIAGYRYPVAALEQAVALLRLGAEPAVAWRQAHHHPELVALATAAQRAAIGGVRLADAARDTAAELRRTCLARQTAAAARAGVSMTAPLAVCFLPAFICLGLAPVIVGLVGELGLW